MKKNRFEHNIESLHQNQLAEYEATLPITERSNPITHDIDLSDSVQIVQLLKKCDEEIFQKEEDSATNYKTLFSESILMALRDTAKQVQEVLRDADDNLIVLSGCGTSGRLAFLLASSFNRLSKTKIYDYIIAGGDKALMTSQELPEDNPETGIKMLKAITKMKKKVLFIGISCGLSAPFVAGQLDFCMNNLDKFTPVLVGFNPINMARPDKIEEWHLTFLQVAERLQELHNIQKAFIINPSVGPEGITGSSRMKGGSATKLLLETVFLAAHKALENNTGITHRCLLDLLRGYEENLTITYSHSDAFAALVNQAGASLQQNGHIYYIGWKSLGIMGIIDASECVPTFGADADHVRGFIYNGFKEMANKEGDMSALGPEFAVSHEHFLKTILPTILRSDTVIFVFTLDDDGAQIEKLARQVKGTTFNLFAISHGTAEQHMPRQLRELFSIIVSVVWPMTLSKYKGSYVQMFHRELSAKWMLNAISTSAHILKGKVYHNYMIDLKVSNSKLFGRALHILQIFTVQTKSQCFKALLKSIYETDELSEKVKNVDISEHIQQAATMSKIVPVALVALMRSCSISTAKYLLASALAVRDVFSAWIPPKAQVEGSPL
ncbi:glucokinase regulatory protein isoform X2 [Rhinoraja longicauda]